MTPARPDPSAPATPTRARPRCSPSRFVRRRLVLLLVRNEERRGFLARGKRGRHRLGRRFGAGGLAGRSGARGGRRGRRRRLVCRRGSQRDKIGLGQDVAGCRERERYESATALDECGTNIRDAPRHASLFAHPPRKNHVRQAPGPSSGRTPAATSSAPTVCRLRQAVELAQLPRSMWLRQALGPRREGAIVVDRARGAAALATGGATDKPTGGAAASDDGLSAAGGTARAPFVSGASVGVVSSSASAPKASSLAAGDVGDDDGASTTASTCCGLPTGVRSSCVASDRAEDDDIGGGGGEVTGLSFGGDDCESRGGPREGCKYRQPSRAQPRGALSYLHTVTGGRSRGAVGSVELSDASQASPGRDGPLRSATDRTSSSRPCAKTQFLRNGQPLGRSAFVHRRSARRAERRRGQGCQRSISGRGSNLQRSAGRAPL